MCEKNHSNEADGNPGKTKWECLMCFGHVPLNQLALSQASGENGQMNLRIETLNTLS